MKCIIVLVVLIGLSQCIHYKVHPLAEKDPLDAGIEKWFDQLLDHSIPTLLTTWKQRVWVYGDYYKANDGLAILYICGEWTCNGLGSATYALTLAQKYNGIVFAIEHRFYGSSQPMGYGEQSQTTESFEKYLNVYQALGDLAYFITQVNQQNLWGVSVNTPWITIGGSYPGAMSAWFRYKYPHLTVGALSSSGVVNAILDYEQFDGQVKTSTAKSGDWCPQTIQSLTKLAEYFISNPLLRTNFLKSWGVNGLNNGEFFYYLADATAGMVQTSKRTQLCSLLYGKNDMEALEVARQLSLDLGIEAYSTAELKNTTYDQYKSSRQWFYQTCTELGYWQTATKDGQALRSSQLNTQFYKKWCRDVFGKTIDGGVTWPDVEITNTYFGGDKLNVKNLIMTNGSEDPWKHASIYKKKLINNDIEVIEIDCDDCGHCRDTKGPKDTDPQALKDARTTIEIRVGEWIVSFRNQHKQSIQIEQ